MLNPADAPLLATFSAVIRGGSFSAAAAELKVAKSVVSERIQLLEQRCGMRLVERTTRRLGLTAAGIEVLASARRLEDELAQLSGHLALRADTPRGPLRVATTGDLAALLVAPAAARLVRTYPQVQAQILADDHLCELVEGRIDLAVRLGVPKQSSQVAVTLATFSEPIVATPELVAGLGRVQRPSDLAAAPWVRHGLIAGPTLSFSGPSGQRDEVAPHFAVEGNTGGTVLSLLLAGAGVGVLPDYQLRDAIRAGQLVEMCPGWSWKTVSLFVQFPARASLSPAGRAMLTMLRDAVALDASRWARRL